MKLETLNPIAKSENFETILFTLDDSPYAFQILTKQLYKNPIASIIRELTSNAIDAHQQANTQDLPITIALPTYLEATFTIEDQGTGLSPEKIKETYTVFFRSDRRNSNKYIGGYGLGAKTPFAYSDQFIITSRYDGIEYQYIALINQKGMPELNLITANQTDLRNGLKIQLPTNPAETWKWEDEAKKLLPRLLAKNNIVVNTKLPKLQNLLFTTSWEILNSDTTLGREIYANIDGILYKIDHSQLFADNSTQIILYCSSNACLILNFTIGDLTITPNREDLSYTPETINKLESAYITAKNEAPILANQLVNACSSYEEACIKYQKLANILYTWKWANHKTLYHSSHPLELISEYIISPIGPIIQLTRSRKSRNFKRNGTYGHLHLNTNYELWYCAPNTKYLTERISEIPISVNCEKLFLPDIDNTKIESIKQALTQTLGTNITYHDLTDLSFTPPLRTNYTTENFKTLSGSNTCPINSAHYYIKQDGNSFPDLPWTQIAIKTAAELIGIDPYYTIIIPKSKWRITKKLNIHNITDLINEQLPILIKQNEEKLLILQLFNQHPNSYIKQFIHEQKNSYNTTLLTDIKGFAIEIPNNINTLLNLFYYTKTVLPDPKNLKGKLDKFYQKYRPLIDEHVTNKTLITAYIHYITSEK